MATILIVEDDSSLRGLYKIALNTFGFQVIGEASNGDEAISIYNSLPEKPDLIIMDHRMPYKNGLETTKEILRINKSAKIIFASADRTIKGEALSCGAKFFLEKPFNNELLVKSIKKVLGNSTIPINKS